MKRNAETGRARVAAPNLRVAPAAKLPYNDEVTTFKHRSSLPLGQVRIKGGAGGAIALGLTFLRASLSKYFTAITTN